jgi:hypothetical protein
MFCVKTTAYTKSEALQTFTRGPYTYGVFFNIKASGVYKSVLEDRNKSMISGPCHQGTARPGVADGLWTAAADILNK